MINPNSIEIVDNGLDFFSKEGNGKMWLTTKATLEVVSLATKKGLAISKIEGFIWHKDVGRFEARLDAIFEGLVNPVKVPDDVNNNNTRAKESTEEDASLGHDAFVVTIASRK
ncbi:hypothetical protein SLJ52_000182 [Pseudomonas aeruginosa]|uniref:hypothetical protein n=1 Tax=Pseudomonas aeruginosa TaxID=287 RepID=UPI0009A203A4|nr:hypothetical protein [Pseudomonas aeruginosa]HCL2783963.1 hypothetical protein [Pseudomonas aeruginosa AC9A]EKQ5873972.1 hypothetical protein [Pseudomonas aeruginosa]EKW2597079.1 hypothetical protein [Pseudomonas aeruginosa]EKY0501964.1 hypothetical protein [Pseudomonas aeruginosa]ELC8326269.1 hypothetical protein [Pseudomonas aeruginosa]